MFFSSTVKKGKNHVLPAHDFCPFSPIYTCFIQNCPLVSPRLYLWQYYDQNPDNLSEDELIDWYMKEFYNLRLKSLNPYELMDILNQKFGNNIIFLCHELPGVEINKEHFCHRRLLADWMELETGILIPELSIDEDGNIKTEKVYNLKPKIKKIIKKY